MMDGRSPRIHLSLTIWTLLLIGLVLVEIRRLPPGLTVLLVPYLALMARHWIGRLRQRDQIEPAISLDDSPASPSEDEPDERADSSGSDGRSGDDDSPQQASPRPTEEPATPPSWRGRARRPRALQVEPLAASWVQVRPGRFVRIEEVSPEHADDSRPDEPHGATPCDVPGAPLEAGSTSADADAEVCESEIEVEASHAGQDPTGAIVPEVRGEGSAESDGSPGSTAKPPASGRAIGIGRGCVVPGGTAT
jgi:hypothetical protein